MDKDEARAILQSSLAPLRASSYLELVRYLDNPETHWVTATSGTKYQVEISANWDDKDRGHLRVMAAVDNGGFSAITPLTDDFILSKDGKLVGE